MRGAALLLAGLFSLSAPARAAEPAAAAPLLSSAAVSPLSPPPPVPASRSAKPPGPDRLDLDATSIRGNQELPKVLYIVPWKEPGVVDLAGRPLNSLVDEALAPVDREVFRRQMNYFEQLYAPSGASPGVGVTAP
jgi:hypothetical protein